MSDDEAGGELNWKDYREPMLYDHVRVRPPRHREHPTVANTHPPLSCPDPRISEGLRGYRCPACTRRMALEGYEWSSREVADRIGSALAGALRQAAGLVRDLPRWAEIGLGAVLLAGPVLAWISAQGWLTWQ